MRKAAPSGPALNDWANVPATVGNEVTGAFDTLETMMKPRPGSNPGSKLDPSLASMPLTAIFMSALRVHEPERRHMLSLAMLHPAAAPGSSVSMSVVLNLYAAPLARPNATKYPVDADRVVGDAGVRLCSPVDATLPFRSTIFVPGSSEELVV